MTDEYIHCDPHGNDTWLATDCRTIDCDGDLVVYLPSSMSRVAPLRCDQCGSVADLTVDD